MKDIRDLIIAKDKELSKVRRELAILKEALIILQEPGDVPPPVTEPTKVGIVSDVVVENPVGKPEVKRWP